MHSFFQKKYENSYSKNLWPLDGPMKQKKSKEQGTAYCNNRQKLTTLWVYLNMF